MKTSIQVLAGVAVGILLALLLPEGNIIFGYIVKISAIAISVGRYIILPLMLFSMIVSVYKLQEKKDLFKYFLGNIGISAIFSAGLVIIGVIISLIFTPEQIPVVIDGLYTENVPGFLELIQSSFPDNFFNLFNGNFNDNSSQFVPFFLFALIFGIFLTKNSKEEIEPTYNLIDSLSRIFYKINFYFYKIAFVWVTIITTSYVLTIKNIVDFEIFKPLIILLVILTLVIILVVYPIIFYYLNNKENPFKYILTKLPLILISSFTGDQLFSISSLIHTQKESLNIKRDYSGYNIPFLTLFSKSGTALVSVISFIVILKSYSSLEITAIQILWVGIMSFLVSFCLPTKAVGSIIASLFLLCSLYGYGGMEDSFIILSPIFPILISVSTVINSSTILLINIINNPEKNKIIL
ncbi:MAG: dicarboxylate/amino acid:cation symporter [Spirochaetales bacterium]|nr:dicarboxylate/amino acid:cation symporter [Spirochaetales bacterium]